MRRASENFNSDDFPVKVFIFSITFEISSSTGSSFGFSDSLQNHPDDNDHERSQNKSIQEGEPMNFINEERISSSENRKLV